jgi:hypothetical protein
MTDNKWQPSLEAECPCPKSYPLYDPGHGIEKRFVVEYPVKGGVP